VKDTSERSMNPFDEAGKPDTSEELAEAGKGRGGLFGRVNQAFQEALTSSRGTREHSPVPEAKDDSHVTADDLAIHRAKTVKPQRMIVPEGVIIDGSMTSGSETEISGRVEGDVTVEGRLYLGATALVSGNVRATSCRVDGLVEGRMECTEELELGTSGRLNADTMAGKRIILAGQVFGNVATGGILRLVSSGKLTGDIRARRLIIEEGAMFNGGCTMRAPAQRRETPKQD
jgi:cytoskeletal protein CcmA (bactofilin family)